MKGIKCCGECAYYSMKKHKCTRGFTAGTESDSFFTDCDLPDAELVKHGHWVKGHCGADEYIKCSACTVKIVNNIASLEGEVAEDYFDLCPKCGARMDGG